MTLLLGGCQAGGSIWKETISLEPKDKTVSEETLDPETDIDGQVESEQVDGAELGQRNLRILRKSITRSWDAILILSN